METRLEVLEAGGGGRPLLLVHGFCGAKEDFADFVQPLAERGWHVVAPDLRGHGASAKPGGEDAYDFAIFVNDLLALVDELGWDRFVLLGHSMGGMIAQHLVLDHASRVAALVLMDTSHAAPDGLDPDLLAAGVEVLRTDGLEKYLELTQAMADDDPLGSEANRRVMRERPGYEEFCARKERDASVDMRVAMLPRFTTQADRLEALRSVQVPTLVIVGEQDAAFVAHSERMAKAIAGARLAVIADAGHSPQFENPDGWWSALASFLDEL